MDPRPTMPRRPCSHRVLTCVNVNVTWAGARTLYGNKRKFDKTAMMLALDPSKIECRKFFCACMGNFMH